MECLDNDIKAITSIIKENFEELLEESELTNFTTKDSKNVRSKLAILYLKAFEITPKYETYKLLAVGELLHNASLLHDDVIDNAKERRNKTTISEKYSSNISILCGDYLIAIAGKLLSELNNATISELFKNCSKKMVDAEIKQFMLRGKKPSINEYIEICTGKTASLFSAIMKSVAIIHNIDINLAGDFGKNFGICFQLNNDLTEASQKQDSQNNIMTIKDIIGIEKSLLLSDNYRGKLKEQISKMLDNTYKRELEGLINKL